MPRALLPPPTVCYSAPHLPSLCSTVNSILNERVANVTAFQQDTAPRPTRYSRRAAGFTLHLIDTPSLLDQDNVSDAVRAAARHEWHVLAAEPGMGQPEQHAGRRWTPLSHLAG